MALFPFFVNLEGRRCLVFGGGKVALRKIRTLLAVGARVEVCSLQYEPEIMALASKGAVCLKDGQTDPGALTQNVSLVVCATSDKAFNERISRLCRSREIPVNCATGEDNSTFIFPSLVVMEGISVGICLQPPAPSLSKKIREDIEAALPPWYSALGRQLAMYRSLLRPMVDDETKRSRIMARLTSYGLEHEGNIPLEIFYEIVERRDMYGDQGGEPEKPSGSGADPDHCRSD